MRELLGELKEDGEAAGSGSSVRSAFTDGNEIGSADAEGSSYRPRSDHLLCSSPATPPASPSAVPHATRGKQRSPEPAIRLHPCRRPCT
ncbi:unnamed protein product [Urochloa humidicola]